MKGKMSILFIVVMTFDFLAQKTLKLEGFRAVPEKKYLLVQHYDVKKHIKEDSISHYSVYFYLVELHTLKYFLPFFCFDVVRVGEEVSGLEQRFSNENWRGGMKKGNKYVLHFEVKFDYEYSELALKKLYIAFLTRFEFGDFRRSKENKKVEANFLMNRVIDVPLSLNDTGWVGVNISYLANGNEEVIVIFPDINRKLTNREKKLFLDRWLNQKKSRYRHLKLIAKELLIPNPYQTKIDTTDYYFQPFSRYYFRNIRLYEKLSSP